MPLLLVEPTRRRFRLARQLALRFEDDFLQEDANPFSFKTVYKSHAE